jgi:hypothetical protein
MSEHGRRAAGGLSEKIRLMESKKTLTKAFWKFYVGQGNIFSG